MTCHASSHGAATEKPTHGTPKLPNIAYKRSYGATTQAATQAATRVAGSGPPTEPRNCQISPTTAATKQPRQPRNRQPRFWGSYVVDPRRGPTPWTVIGKVPTSSTHERRYEGVNLGGGPQWSAVHPDAVGPQLAAATEDGAS